MSRKVIDLSKWNGQNPIIWKTVKENVDGIIFRVGLRGFTGNGRLKMDEMFKTYLANCVQFNIPFGVYWFAQEISKKEAIESANYIYELIKDYKLSYPVYYDVEYSGEPFFAGRADSINSTTRTDCIIAFCEEIKRLGFVPGVYSNEFWFNKMIEFDRIKKYNIWCAKYNNNTGKPEVPPKIHYDMWQYTDKGKIPGIEGYVDISEEESALITEFGSPTIGHNVDMSVYEDIACQVIDGKWGNGKDRELALTKAGYDYKEIQKIVNEMLTFTNCDMIGLTPNAKYTNGKSIPQWVINSKLFVRSIRENGDLVISTVQEGPITGVIDKKYAIKLTI